MSTDLMPPPAVAEELYDSALLLRGFRREMNNKSLSIEWRKWIARSIIAGCEQEEADAADVIQ